MMEAKDTELTPYKAGLAISQMTHSERVIFRNGTKLQAKVSFKVGIKEVVDWINETVDFDDEYPCPYYVLNKKVWEAKLKEWGIEEEPV